MSSERLQWFKAAPGAYEALRGVEAYIQKCGLERSLMELVKMRASQINGCAYCLDMHSKDARAAARREQRLYLLDAWRESPLYSDARAGGAGLDRGADAGRRHRTRRTTRLTRCGRSSATRSSST